MKLPRHILPLCLLCLLCLLSCADHEEQEAQSRRTVTLITSVGGLGDMGYNDLILSGVMHFHEQHAEVGLSLVRPASAAEAGQALDEWLARPSDGAEHLLVLAEDSHEDLLRARHLSLKPGQHILLFESQGVGLPAGVSTIAVDRYGAAWLAGVMSSAHTSATVIAAKPGSATLDRAIEGFTQGYAEHHGTPPEVIYLAEDDGGYAMPDSAYRVAALLDDTIILPLAGGSNEGVYKSTREVFNLCLVIGVDADCSWRSPNLPFSLVVRMDQVVEQWLERWVQGDTPEGHTTHGLDTGATDIVPSPVFYANAFFFLDYYVDNPFYWEETRAAHFEEALRQEQAHAND